MKKARIHFFFTKLRIDLDKILYVATTSWFVEAHAQFTLHKYYSREREDSADVLL